MKNLKRVLIAVLALALLVSTALIGFANDEAEEPEYRDILKYYDPLYSTILIDEDFEGDGYYGFAHSGANDTIANKFSTKGEDNKYLSVTAGDITNSAAIGDMLYVCDLDVETGLFLLDFSIRATHTPTTIVKCQNEECGTTTAYKEDVEVATCPVCEGDALVTPTDAPTIVLYLDQNKFTGSAPYGVPYLVMDFAAGTIQYYSASSYYTLNFDLAEDKWYDIQIEYYVSGYTLTVTDRDSGASATAEDIGTVSVFDVASFMIGYNSMYDNRGTEFMIDDVYVQLGDSYRNVSDEELFNVTVAALGNMSEMLESPLVAREVKVDVISVFDELVEKYDLYTVIGEDETANQHVDAILSSLLSVYAGMLKEGTDTINKSLSYEERLLHISAYTEFANKVALHIEEDSPAEIIEVYNAYLDEVEELRSDEEYSLRFIAEINALMDAGYDFYSTDYEVVKHIYETITAVAYVDGEYQFNTTYPGIAELLNAFNIASNSYLTSVTKSELFINAVNSIAVATTEEERLAAYATASQNKFTNTTYPGVAEALATFETYTDLKAIGDYAEEFLGYIKSADAALNLTSKSDLLDKAEAMLDDVNEFYPGVLEAKEHFHNVRKDIDDSYANAAAYINAVNALAGLDGDELRAAIATALELQKTGNILEIDGVVEANIALDAAKSEVDLIDAYADKFIKLVGMIDSEADIPTRYAAIIAAKDAELDADDSIDGVTAAKLQLASCVAQYESEINAINDAFASASVNAASFAGAAVSYDGIFLTFVGFIKALFG